MKSNPDPSSPRVLVVSLHHAAPCIFRMRADNVAATDANIRQMVENAAALPENQTQWFHMENTDVHEPMGSVNVRAIIGWHFYEPDDGPQRMAAAMERAINPPPDESEKWKEGDAS